MQVVEFKPKRSTSAMVMEQMRHGVTLSITIAVPTASFGGRRDTQEGLKQEESASVTGGHPGTGDVSNRTLREVVNCPASVASVVSQSDVEVRSSIDYADLEPFSIVLDMPSEGADEASVTVRETSSWTSCPLLEHISSSTTSLSASNEQIYNFAATADRRMCLLANDECPIIHGI